MFSRPCDSFVEGQNTASAKQDFSTSTSFVREPDVHLRSLVDDDTHHDQARALRSRTQRLLLVVGPGSDPASDVLEDARHVASAPAPSLKVCADRFKFKRRQKKGARVREGVIGRRR